MTPKIMMVDFNFFLLAITSWRSAPHQRPRTPKAHKGPVKRTSPFMS